MRFHKIAVALLWTATTATGVVASVPASTSTSTFALRSSTQQQQREGSLFGITKSLVESSEVLAATTALIPRGGAVAQDTSASSEESEEEEAPSQQLYLPGLLTASVLKKTVSEIEPHCIYTRVDESPLSHSIFYLSRRKPMDRWIAPSLSPPKRPKNSMFLAATS